MLPNLRLGVALLALFGFARAQSAPKLPHTVTFTAVFDVLKPMTYSLLPDLLFLLQHLEDTDDRGRFELDVRFVITDQSSLIESAIQMSMFRNDLEKWKQHMVAAVGHISDQGDPIKLWIRSCAVSGACDESVTTLHEMLATLQSNETHLSGFFDQSYIDEFVKATGVEEKKYSQSGLQVEGTFIDEDRELVRGICEVIQAKRVTGSHLCTYEGIQEAKRALVRESNSHVRLIQTGIYLFVLIVMGAMIFFHCQNPAPIERKDH